MQKTDDTLLIFRPIQPADVEKVSALWIDCNLVTSYNDPRTDIEFAAGKYNSEIIIGLLDEMIVASVMVGHDGHRGWLYYVAVDPHYQSKGYGASIVVEGEKWLSLKGVAAILLLIRDTNTAVQSFYSSIGYQSIPRTVMQKWLNSPNSNA